MDIETIILLRTLNRNFYDELGPSFSVTRAQIQPGVKILLPEMLAQPKILDLGCGNGTLAEALALSNYEGQYLGVDGSQTLLSFAKERLQPYPLMRARFELADLLDSALADKLAVETYPLIVCFATLQHLPSSTNHQKFFMNARQMLAPGGQLMLSCWQIHNSQRLIRHILDWSVVGLRSEELEKGDLLMDWRSQDLQKPGLRYVHEFSAEELQTLGEQAGLHLSNSFYSDGGEGNLALYQTWTTSEATLD